MACQRALSAGAVALLIKASASVATAQTTTQADSTTETVEFPFATSYVTDDFTQGLATLCDRARDAFVPSDSEPPNPVVSCWFEEGPAFTPTATYLGLFTMRVRAGREHYSSLVVATPQGLLRTGIAWDISPYGDPGCPSFIREIAIERVFVEHGILTVVLVGETTGMIEPGDPPDAYPRLVLQRTLALVAPDPEGFRILLPQSSLPPNLGQKTQPTHIANTPWHQIPWRDEAPFRVTKTGVVEVTLHDETASL